jgi:hypothetical protein
MHHDNVLFVNEQDADHNIAFLSAWCALVMVEKTERLHIARVNAEGRLILIGCNVER